MTKLIVPIENFEFPKDVISDAVQNNRLLSMEIEFSLRCNFRCTYCYVPHENYFQDELTVAEIKNAIQQAQDLGAVKIIILGGEPSIYPHTPELIRFIHGLGLQTEIFTNGTGITPEFAAQLYAYKARVVLKMNSRNPALQDQLAGYSGAYQIIQKALGNLKEAGYPSRNHFLAVSSIICRQNLSELPKLWQWLREQQMAPYFEIMTPQANARQNDWLYVDPLEIEPLFERIRDLDARLFGQVWETQPPLVGSACMRHQFSCLLTSKGNVTPCVGIPLAMGNIRRQPLRNILAGSPIRNDLINYRHTIKGPCRTCEKAPDCYGCRGAAFQLTGDYLASDPLCWRNARRASPTGGRPDGR